MVRARRRFFPLFGPGDGKALGNELLCQAVKLAAIKNDVANLIAGLFAAFRAWIGGRKTDLLYLRGPLLVMVADIAMSALRR